MSLHAEHTKSLPQPDPLHATTKDLSDPDHSLLICRISDHEREHSDRIAG